MIEYKILKQLPFFLERDKVTEEELEKHFTMDAINDLEKSGFISKLSQPEHYKFYKAGTTIEVTTPAGVKFTREILEEFSKHIFGEKEVEEKPIPTWRENPPIKNEDLKNEKVVQDFIKNSFDSIYDLKERAIQSMIPIGLSFTAMPGEKVTSEKSEESKKEADMSIPTRNSEFFKKWQEQMFESIGANNPNISEEEKQTLLKRYPTILKGYFEKESTTRDCEKEVLDVLAEGLVVELFKTKVKNQGGLKMPKFEELKSIEGWYMNTDSFIDKTLPNRSTSRHYNVYPTEELARAAQVQGKLYQCYHEALRLNCPDWEYSWSDDNCKYGIKSYRTRVFIEPSINYKYPFPFPTKELAQAFLDTHKEDLEIYKPLM
jgi:hypothetical protein